MTYEISTKSQFDDEIVDRKLVQENSWVIISSDGKVSGKSLKNGKIDGSWNWEDGFYCRDIVVDDNPRSIDCQSVSREGDIVTFTHEKGTGVSISWRIE